MFINKLRKFVNVDAENQAKIYWIKNEQRKYFASEIDYLENKIGFKSKFIFRFWWIIAVKR